MQHLKNKKNQMNLKKIILLGAVIFSCSLWAQQGEAPTSIIQGTFIGKTIPLRDYPTVAENTVTDPKDIIIVPNNFSILGIVITSMSYSPTISGTISPIIK